MKHKLKIILLDLLYFLLFTIILISTRQKIRDFLINIQGFGISLQTVNINENLQEAQNLLSQLNVLAVKAYLFLFLIVPLIIFILYILFQSLAFKKHNFSYKRFILISLIPFIILILSMFLFNIYLAIFFIIASYLAFVLYFYDFKKLKIAYKKIYILFPIYLLYLVLPILAIGFFYLAYTRIFISIDAIWIFMLAALFSLMFSYYKIYLVKKLV